MKGLAQALGSLHRHPDPQYQWHEGVFLSNLQRWKRLNPETFPVIGVSQPVEPDYLSEWDLAKSLAAHFEISCGRHDLAGRILEAALTVSHTDRAVSSCTLVGSDAVVGVDAGLMSSLARMAKFLGVYWRYPGEPVSRVKPQPRYPGPHLMERIFRIYFRSLRYDGYFSLSYFLEPAPDSLGLIQSTTKIAWVFVLLHEIAHFVRRLEQVVLPNQCAEEIACDRLAVMFAGCLTEFGVDAGLLALGIRHYFETLRVVEAAVFMMHPVSHPPAGTRLSHAMKCLFDVGGPTGAVTWSQAVHRPLCALVDLSCMSPPFLGMEDDPLPSVIERVAEVVDITLPDLGLGDTTQERQANWALALSRFERAEYDIFAVDPLRLLAHYLSRDGLIPDNHAAQEWLATIVESHREELSILRKSVPTDGLAFSRLYWVTGVDGMSLGVAHALWGHLARGLGWLPDERSGMRAWGCSWAHTLDQRLIDVWPGYASAFGESRRAFDDRPESSRYP